MALENTVEALVEILTRIADQADQGLYAGLNGGAAEAAPAKKPASTGDKKPAASGGKTVDVAAMKAAVMKVKDEVSEDAAKAIIVKFAGKGKKLADLINLPEKFAAVVKACEAAIKEAEDGDEQDDEDDDGSGL